MRREVEELVEMLTYQRQQRSRTEEEFIKKYIDSIPSIKKDAYGNRYKRVGKTDTSFTSHTDTVHYNSGDGRQEVYVDNGFAHTGRENILGGDNTGGVWLCINMIKSRVPGLYIFHRDEEHGGLGSRWIAENNEKLFSGINKVISFDRKGYGDVVTRQRGTECCSKEFAKALSKQLGGEYRPDPTGVFTDSANYTRIVPECTNLSIGYFDAHSPNESLDLVFIFWLLNRLKQVDWSSLPVVRNPKPAYTYQSYYSPKTYERDPFGYGSSESFPKTYGEERTLEKVTLEEGDRVKIIMDSYFPTSSFLKEKEGKIGIILTQVTGHLFRNVSGNNIYKVKFQDGSVEYINERNLRKYTKKKTKKKKEQHTYKDFWGYTPQDNTYDDISYW